MTDDEIRYCMNPYCPVIDFRVNPGRPLVTPPDCPECGGRLYTSEEAEDATYELTGKDG